jgi:hypothetical protein
VIIAAGLVIAALVLLLVLQASHNRHQAERLGQLERWAAEKDPEAFGIYPDLEPDPPTAECAGVHPVGRDGRTCEACGVVLV